MLRTQEFKRLLKHNKLNTNELSTMLGISRPTLSSYINNKIDIPAKYLLAICYILHCEINEIYADNSKEFLLKGGNYRDIEK